jgi:enterochelin esterase-like enzyme
LRAFAFVFLVTIVAIRAQDPPVLTSPDVHSDRTVTFRFWAPRANEVQLSGNWMGTQPPLALTKDAVGVWTVKTGPFEPNIYDYAFLVDGARAIDPACKCGLISAARFASSRFTIRGTPPRSWEAQNRASGTLHHHRFFSKRQQLTRRFVVYTPAGYESSGDRRYPVVVLMPGTPGDENDWTSGGGSADIMFDNLIADGRMQPMLVVMHASDVLEPPDLRRGDENMMAFETIIIDELLPLVKQRYRTAVDPRMWAIAGLSLGGEFGMYVGLKHPEQFRTIVSISSSLVPSSFEARFPIADPKRTANEFRLIWLGIGSDDIFYDGAKAFAARLAAKGVPHVYKEYRGGHVMPVFRQELDDVLPLVFR